MRRILAIAATVAVISLALIVVIRAHGRAAAPRYITVPVKYGNISAAVNESGTVNPVNEVQVGTEVSGTVSKLNVDYNSTVKKGQVLAELQPTSFQAADMQARGTLAAAQAQASAQSSTMKQAEANIQAALATEQQQRANALQAQANIAKAQSQLKLDHSTAQRDRQLLAQGYISQSQADADATTAANDEAALRAAQAAYAAAQAQAAAALSQVRGAQAQAAASASQRQVYAGQIEADSGQVQQASYNLSRTVIRSPIDGIVVSRGVSVGQTVAASFQTPTLFVIASSLKDMQIDVSVDEADVGNLHTGDSATITVPAFPNVDFHGTVKQLRVNPTVTQNVVTYDAVVAVHDDSARLMPGMTANVTIAVAKHAHALVVPTSALLYRPSGGGGGTAGAPGSKVTLSVLRESKPVQVPVLIGLSDGTNVEITSGDLHEGDAVIVAALQSRRVQTSSPFGVGPRGGR
ncbi:MAG: efflux RND transporter periplasmic adaptor subunit [bacterium]|nr:efflux RND transporter periplasmic adaptor subunit [bacterium]